MGAMVCNVGVYMVEIWVLSLFFNFFVGAAAPTKFSVAPPLVSCNVAGRALIDIRTMQRFK